MTSPPFVACVSKGRTALLLLGTIAIVGVGIWFVISSTDFAPHQDPTFVATLGWAAIFFSGSCGAAIFTTLFRTAPVIEIDGHGFRWRDSSVAPIPWSAVKRMEIMRVPGTRFVTIWLRDPDLYIRRGLLGGFGRTGFGDIALSTAGTDRSFGDLLVAMRTFAREFGPG